MQAYKSIIADNTTLILSTDSDLFKFLRGMTPAGADGVAPDEPSGFQTSAENR
jgi:membrane protease subunit HflC